MARVIKRARAAAAGAQLLSQLPARDLRPNAGDALVRVRGPIVALRRPIAVSLSLASRRMSCLALLYGAVPAHWHRGMRSVATLCASRRGNGLPRLVLRAYTIVDIKEERVLSRWMNGK